MSRKNGKEQVVSYENSIKKSNKLSMSKLNQGLTLNEMQLLAYAIYSTQQDGKTEFRKADFERKFGIKKYQTVHAKKDAQRILDLKFSIEDLENDYFEYWNVFQSIRYDSGSFRFKWTDDMVPHILELKKKYVSTDLTITSQFGSEFSWTLYEYLKAHYGFWRKSLSKNALMRLFGVDTVKSYQSNTGLFKKKVLDVAIAELNRYTELDVWYKEEKKGRSIVGFDLQWTTGEKVASATKKQIQELKAITDAIQGDMFKYLNLDNQSRRNQAIELVRKSETMKIHTKAPICITKEHAQTMIQDATFAIQHLEQLYAAEHHGQNERDTSFYYNWLEED